MTILSRWAVPDPLYFFVVELAETLKVNVILKIEPMTTNESPSFLF